MADKSASPEYSKPFRRALRDVISAQVADGRVSPKSAVAEELFDRADPWTIVSVLLETVVTLASDGEGDVDPVDRIDRAVDDLRPRKRAKRKR